MEEGLKYIASVSFGKDSLAMLLKIIGGGLPLDEVVFFDTEVEFKSIYKIRDKVIPLLEEKGIKYTELTDKYGFEYWMFDAKVKYRKKEGYHIGYGWCGGHCRWGTALKREAIKGYFRGQKYKLYLGIAADEVKRIDRNTNEVNILPLVEWGMTEAECLEYCHSLGYYWLEDNDIELYDYINRSACFCCSNKNLQDLRNMYHYFPYYWEWLKKAQTRIERKFKREYTVQDLEKRFKFEDEWLASGKGSIRSKEFYKALKEHMEGNYEGN